MEPKKHYVNCNYRERILTFPKIISGLLTGSYFLLKMDSGVISDDYTEALDAEVKSVKSDEKVRMSYMLLQEAFARERQFGIYKNNVKMIRRKIQQLSIPDMADMFAVSADNCKSVVDTINAHPDWDDEQVAEEIYWDD